MGTLDAVGSSLRRQGLPLASDSSLPSLEADMWHSGLQHDPPTPFTLGLFCSDQHDVLRVRWDNEARGYAYECGFKWQSRTSLRVLEK